MWDVRNNMYHTSCNEQRNPSLLYDALLSSEDFKFKLFHMLFSRIKYLS